MQYARLINGQEALEKISDVQLGIDLDILPIWEHTSFNELVSITRPNFLHKYMGRDTVTSNERDAYRATVIRQKLGDRPIE